jgi:ribosomal protein L28
MSKICMVCAKGYLKANLVPRGIGRRVTKRTITRKQPNLRSKRFMINGTSLKLILCASCLKRIKYEDRLAAAEVAAATVQA